MSNEMKDILKTMIDNNEPHWSADTMDMVRVELENLYTQAPKADEYEVKAKAWDNMKRDFEEISHTPMAQHILFNMSLIMEDVESGEQDVKK